MGLTFSDVIAVGVTLTFIKALLVTIGMMLRFSKRYRRAYSHKDSYVRFELSYISSSNTLLETDDRSWKTILGP